ncbi:hypothetical protein NX059_000972 [Plenodomus lindquistii]|nr:hypothetical protein NX059_000972 [Plenodomus lindquistii]
MQYIILALAAAASCVSAQSVSSSAAASTSTGAVVPVGGNCTPGVSQCALGSSCYATNSGLQPRCGNFQAPCTNDQQCAFNTCNLQQGLCNGFVATSSSTASPSVSRSSTPAFSPAPSSTVTAAPGTLPLGAQCNPFANPSQCMAGVQCWASNSGLIASCGNFNAACTSNAQCAFNTCNNGLCNGFLASSSTGNGTSTVRPTGGSSSTATIRTTGGMTAIRSATPTTSMVQFTGAAPVANVAGGVMAMVLGSVAWAL